MLAMAVTTTALAAGASAERWGRFGSGRRGRGGRSRTILLILFLAFSGGGSGGGSATRSLWNGRSGSSNHIRNWCTASATLSCGAVGANGGSWDLVDRCVGVLLVDVKEDLNMISKNF